MEEKILLQLGELQGVVREGFKNCNGHLERLEADLALIKKTQQKENVRLAFLEERSIFHGARLTELFRRTNSTEKTAITETVKRMTTWYVLKTIAAALVAVGGLAFAAWQIWS